MPRSIRRQETRAFSCRQGGETGQQTEKLKLFEFDDSGQEHVWRLLVSCEVEVLGDLTAFYERIQGEKRVLRGTRTGGMQRSVLSSDAELWPGLPRRTPGTKNTVVLG